MRSARWQTTVVFITGMGCLLAVAALTTTDRRHAHLAVGLVLGTGLGVLWWGLMTLAVRASDSKEDVREERDARRAAWKNEGQMGPDEPSQDASN
jgi:4-amino-4-deoxy-L-arabinose transferase-like glycosyltransferase